ncbi:MAG: septal ring factor EnvC (AmiA/AmiB activator) [Sphingobacteriales bacterium]|jgi:septal ring factor EnvC (AmiA/AmiB activator)
MNGLIKLVLGLLLSVFFISLSAQSREELETRRIKLNQEIALTNQLLEKTQKNKTTSLDALVTLNKKISSQEKLILNLEKEVSLINNQIGSTSGKIESLQEELQQLKVQYAHMIRFADKNKDAYNQLMFIFSAQGFNQAYKRMRYIQQYSGYRKKQAEIITGTTTELSAKLIELESQKQDKNKLLLEVQAEKVKLDSNKGKQASLVKSLQEEESKLKKEIRAKQQASDKLKNAIEAAIKRELEEARKRAEANKKGSSSGLNLTEDQKKVSAAFTAAKGQIPWPVEQGIVTERFGTHAHPVLSGIMVKSDGIDIRTQSGAKVKSVFEGKVTGILSIPDYNTMIMVNHGEYLTVYAKIGEVNVQKGDYVKKGQVLGTVFNNESSSKSEVHFQILKVSTMQKQNPESWILKR